MGADLCGLILIGPMKLDKNKVKKAIKHVEKTMDTIAVAISKEKGMFPSESRLAAIEELRKLLSRVSPEADHAEILEEAEELDGCDSSVVTDFVEVWNNEPYRDIMSRTLPGNKKRKIFVCGDKTWGDGPDPDSAWGIADLVARFSGLFEILGVE